VVVTCERKANFAVNHEYTCHTVRECVVVIILFDVECTDMLPGLHTLKHEKNLFSYKKHYMVRDLTQFWANFRIS